MNHKISKLVHQRGDNFYNLSTVWRGLHAEGVLLPDGGGELQVRGLVLLPDRPSLQKELVQRHPAPLQGAVR